MSIQRARTVEEYVEWIRQAVFEVDDLRECLEFEMETVQRFPVFLDALEKGIKDLYQSLQDGSYHFGREDLPFMELVDHHGEDIPFQMLLKQLNATHRLWLDVTDED